MATDPLVLAVVLVFIAVAVLSALLASVVLAQTSPERRRLRQMEASTPLGASGVLTSVGSVGLTDRPDVLAKRIATIVPKSPKEMGRLERRMVRAGFKNPARAAVYYAAAEVVCPLVLALATLTLF